MAYTYHELKEKTIQELRDIAKDVRHDAVQGYSQMNKEHLLPALCRALGVDIHEHHDVKGIDKVRERKQQRDAALEARDQDRVKAVRRHLHRLNRQIRAHMA